MVNEAPTWLYRSTADADTGWKPEGRRRTGSECCDCYVNLIARIASDGSLLSLEIRGIVHELGVWVIERQSG